MKVAKLFLFTILTYQQLVSCEPGACSAVTKPICDSLQKAGVMCKCSGSNGQCALDAGQFIFACPETERYKWGRDTCNDFCVKGGAQCSQTECYNS